MNSIEKWQKNWDDFLRENKNSYLQLLHADTVKSLENLKITSTSQWTKEIEIGVNGKLVVPMIQFTAEINDKLSVFSLLRDQWVQNGKFINAKYDISGKNLSETFNVSKEEGDLINIVFNKFNFLKMVVELE